MRLRVVILDGLDPEVMHAQARWLNEWQASLDLTLGTSDRQWPVAEIVKGTAKVENDQLTAEIELKEPIHA